MPSKLPRVMFTVDPCLKEKLIKIAENEDCSVAVLVRDQVKKLVRRYEVTNGKILED